MMVVFLSGSLVAALAAIVFLLFRLDALYGKNLLLTGRIRAMSVEQDRLNASLATANTKLDAAQTRAAALAAANADLKSQLANAVTPAVLTTAADAVDALATKADGIAP